MSGSAQHPLPQGADLRVIVVGRPAVESALRRDERIELIRARTPAMALGELRFGRIGEGAARTAVLLSAEALSEAEMEGFARAARAVDPSVRLVGAWSVERSGADIVDARVAAGADGAALRAALDGAPDRRSSPPAKPAANAPAPPDTPALAHAPDDASVVEAMLRAGDVVTAALKTIERRLGARARFVEIGGHGAPVQRGDTLFGSLEAEGADERRLGEEAAWLASWLALEQQHKQLQTAAFTDDLTGSWNRRYFRRFLQQAIEQARGQRRDVTLMVYDIDDFKQYNDRFGHAAGDEILTETVRLLRSVIRPTDRVCRVGGDEFAVIFDDPRGARSANAQHPASIAGIAERFQRQICAHLFPKLGSDALSTLTISGGMATFPWDGQDAESLLAKADALALESKRQGKNVITLGPGAERVCRLRFPDPDAPGPTG